MTTKREAGRWGTEKKWFSSSEAARYLSVSVDTIRQLDASGQLRASRTTGDHRRFARRALDAYRARKRGGRSARVEERPKRSRRPVAPPAPICDPISDDPEGFEPGDEEFEPFIGAPPPPLSPMEQLSREMDERRKREDAEASLRRLAGLKEYGLNHVPYLVPDRWRGKVAAALETFVTPKNVPAWIADVQAYAIVRGKVEELLQPYHDEASREKAENARREEEAASERQREQEEVQEERRVQELINDGMRHARSAMLSDWEFEDRARALRDVERMLKDSVEADWTEQDVKDAIDDELDEWEDDSPDGDEEDES
jgi:excisionase family DNA binding protein